MAICLQKVLFYVIYVTFLFIQSLTKKSPLRLVEQTQMFNLENMQSFFLPYKRHEQNIS